MKRNGSASQWRGQGEHPKPFGLPVHQGAHILGLISVRSFDLRRISDHEAGFFVEERSECFLRIVVLQKTLDTFVTGGFFPFHSGGDITQTGRAGCHDPFNNLARLPGCRSISK